MSSRKSQHFIPRFYLKIFSHSNNKTISLFNIKKEVFIPVSSIKHQACSNFFYGRDGVVENNLGKLETIFSDLILRIIELKELPIPKTEKHIHLSIFIISLLSRTKFAGEKINELFDKTLKIVYKEDPRFKDYLKNIKIGVEYPGTYSLGIALKTVPVILDLEYKLLNNITEVSFITSDNPVIKYNQFLEYKNAIGCITGFAAKGIQIMFPLSPGIYIIFYDRNIYKVGSRKQKIIQINNSNDVDKLNLLQIVNASENVYTNRKDYQSYMESLTREGKKFRRDKKVEVMESLPNKMDNGSMSALIVSHEEDIKINLELSFIGLTKKAKKYRLSNRIVHIRSEEVQRICELITYKGEDEE